MPVLLRIPFAVLLWALCWWAIREKKPKAETSGTRFVTEQPASPETEAKPLFSTETISTGPGLPMVHVAVLAQTSDGILHAVWYGGTAECHPDVKIYLSQKATGRPWSAPVAIMTRERAEQDLRRPVKALGNALLIAENDGSLRLLFVTIAMGKWSGSQLNACVSRDGGFTWSCAERLTLSPFFNLSELVRNRPVRISDGSWCVPIYQEFLGKFPELLWLGTDGAYRKSRIAGGCTTFQPSIVPETPPRVLALLRDYSDDRKVYRSFSVDGGEEWSRPVPTSLPNPDAGISGLLLSDTNTLVAFNDSPKNRADLSLSITPDGGATWSRPFALEREEGASFSYPFLFRTRDGLIRLTYTWKGREIRLITFNENWLNNRAKQDQP